MATKNAGIIIAIIAVVVVIGLLAMFVSNGSLSTVSGTTPGCEMQLVKDAAGNPIKDFDALRSYQRVTFTDKEFVDQFQMVQKSDGVYAQLCVVSQ